MQRHAAAVDGAWDMPSPTSPHFTPVSVTPTKGTTPLPLGTARVDQLPFVFLLDIDGTIVGNVKFQVTRYSLLKMIEGENVKLPTSVNKTEVPDAYEPEDMMVRPGFKAFVEAMQAKYSNARFFIYTASETQWADKEIKWIEKSLGMKFERPLFTRKDCIHDVSLGYRKSVQKVLPRIWKCLSRYDRYSLEEKRAVEQGRLIVVDNMPVFNDYTERLVLCPTYDYVYVEDILKNIPEEVLHIPSIKREIDLLEREKLVVPSKIRHIQDPMIRNAQYHKWLFGATKSAIEVNRVHIQDTFWRKLRKVFTRYDNRKLSKEFMDHVKQTCLKSSPSTKR